MNITSHTFQSDSQPRRGEGYEADEGLHVDVKETRRHAGRYFKQDRETLRTVEKLQTASNHQFWLYLVFNLDLEAGCENSDVGLEFRRVVRLFRQQYVHYNDGAH